MLSVISERIEMIKDNFSLLLILLMRDLFYLQGGDILLETISSNVTEDLITLEFQRSDGTLVTQLIDFKNVITSVKTLWEWGEGPS